MIITTSELKKNETVKEDAIWIWKNSRLTRLININFIDIPFFMILINEMDSVCCARRHYIFIQYCLIFSFFPQDLYKVPTASN